MAKAKKLPSGSWRCQVYDYTLKAAIENYCNLKSNALSPATIREYLRMKDSYFGELGDVHIKDINSERVQAWVNEFAINHSPKTVRNAYVLISTVMDAFARDIRLRVTLPQKVQSKLYVLSDSDIKALLAYLAENNKDYGDCCLYCCLWHAAVL